jgi:hypothetical protein
MNAAAFAPGLAETDGLPTSRTIPFDYAFRYELSGTRDNVLNQTVTVSVEAAFVAVSIGYGVIPITGPLTFGVKAPQTPAAPVITAPVRSFRSLGAGVTKDLLEGLAGALKEPLQGDRPGPQTAVALAQGIRLNPAFAEFIAIRGGAADLDDRIAAELFQVVPPPTDQIQFLYSLFDEGSGREFQSEPILNIAGLGISNGDRPFRYFAKPIAFAPRTAIRLEIREISEFKGQLHVSLHGYKMLGGPGTPTGRAVSARGRGRRR